MEQHPLASAGFELHPQLATDCEIAGDLRLCRVLLAKDANYPWLILVPMRAGVKEAYELNTGDQRQLSRESNAISQGMAELFRADKMNIAALGNIVPQLHLHHIARYRSDAAWPKPVWGLATPLTYEKNSLQQRLEEIRSLMARLKI